MLAPGSPRLDTNFSPIMGYFYNTETENHYAYNPEKAKQLLADAGESDLTFSIKVPVEYQFHMDTALLMQSHLQEIGVTMNIVPIEWNTWLSEVYGSALYEASIVGLTGKLDPDAVLGRFESTFRRNFYKYNNPEYDAISKKLAKPAIWTPAENYITKLNKF
jgi:peptide/nickel transport system substrate-binding protein